MKALFKRSTAVTTWIITCVLLFLILASNSALAAKTILNIENSPINSTQTLSIEEVERVIIEGCRVRGWQANVIAPGHIEAVLYIRSHVAKVDIPFTPQNYSITYKDSVNLDYKNGKIHRNYNKWVQNLNKDIQSKIPY